MKKVQSREEFLLALDTYLPRNCNAIEIGVYKGDFAKKIWDIIKPCYLHLVDPYETGGKEYPSGLNSAYSNVDDFNALLKIFERELIWEAVSIERDYSYNAVRRVGNVWADFIYHDASHLYADIKRDLNDWLPKLKQDGLICGHDYAEHEGFGVIQAVEEFCKEQDFEMILFNENGGDYALKRKE